MSKIRFFFFASALLLVLNQPVFAQFRDPTQPASLQSAEQVMKDNNDSVYLSAIWHSPLAKRATLNDITLKQGQSVNGITLLQVNQNSVVIKHQEHIKTLYLIRASYKSAVSH